MKRKKQITHHFKKRKYTVRFTSVAEMGDSRTSGLCDPPFSPDPVIDIRENLPEKEMLEVLIHESLHALAFHKTEAAVFSSAESIAMLLWKLGYRRVSIS